MAIVFNSDAGTISGLSVGGLPDGIVDAGTLATNSVDSAELIDGAVDNSHMAAMAASKLTGALPAISGASLTGLTSTQMPSGTCVQFASDSDSASIAASGTSFTDTNLSISFTPKFSDSIIVVQAIALVNIAGAGNQHGQAEVLINKNGSAFGEAMRWMTGYGGTEALLVGPCSCWQYGAQGNTNAEVYKVQFRLVQSLGSATYNPYGGNSMLFIWEIKA
jgi:hypothetical protein